MDIEALLVSQEVFAGPHFLSVIMHLMLKQNDFYSLQHHAYREPSELLISLAGSWIFEIQYRNLEFKKVLYKQLFSAIL